MFALFTWFLYNKTFFTIFYSSKIETLLENRNFPEKSKFCSKLEILLKNQNFVQNLKCWSTLKILATTISIFEYNFEFWGKVWFLRNIFIFWAKFRFLSKISIFDQNFEHTFFSFWKYFCRRKKIINTFRNKNCSDSAICQSWICQ